MMIPYMNSLGTCVNVIEQTKQCVELKMRNRLLLADNREKDLAKAMETERDSVQALQMQIGKLQVENQKLD